jgi:dTDP-4-dehydrorhamnose reductase
MKTMVRLAGERDSLGVVDDQFGRPTFARDLADAVRAIIRRLPDETAQEGWGIFHAASQGETTWCGFARAIMDGSRARGGLAAEVRPISTADFPTPARRPADSRLSTERLASVYDVRLPAWQDSLAVCLDEIYGLPTTGTTR